MSSQHHVFSPKTHQHVSHFHQHLFSGACLAPVQRFQVPHKLLQLCSTPIALLLHRSHSEVGLGLPDAPGTPLHPYIVFPRCISTVRVQMSAEGSIIGHFIYIHPI